VKVKVGFVTAPTVNGNTSVVDVSSHFSAGEPLQQVILLAAYNTVDGAVDDDGILSLGFVGRDGAAISEGYLSYFDEGTGSTGTSACGRGLNTGGALKGFSASAAPPTVDYIANVTALGDTGFTITWTDAPATAIRVMYVALGGADFAKAIVFSFTTVNAATVQDVQPTALAGKGKPDALMMMSVSGTTLGDSQSAAVATLCVSNLTGQRTETMCQNHGETSMDVGVYHWDQAFAVCGSVGGAPAVRASATLEPLASNWPADGFRLNFSKVDTQATHVLGIAMYGAGPAGMVIGDGVVPITGTPPVAQALGQGEGMIVWTCNIPANATVDTIDLTAGSLAGFAFGAYDGVAEGCGGVVQDDGHTTSQASRWWNETKVTREMLATIGGAAAVQSEADGTKSGADLGLSFNDIDTIERVYSYVLFPAGGGAEQTLTGTGIATAEAFGSGAVELPPLTLTGTGIASEEAFGAGTVTAGAVTITGTGIASAEALGVGVVGTGELDIVGVGIASGELFGAGTLEPFAAPTQGRTFVKSQAVNRGATW
jgi:hypothetical protein